MRRYHYLHCRLSIHLRFELQPRPLRSPRHPQTLHRSGRLLRYHLNYLGPLFRLRRIARQLSRQRRHPIPTSHWVH